MRKEILLLILCAMAWASPAAAEPKAVAGLSDDFVAVNESFDGAHLMVFGLLKSWADVAIVVEGPPMQGAIRKKERHAGIWINGEPQTIAPVPSYYAVVTSRPIATMVSEDVAKKYKLGTDALPFADQEGGRGLIAAQIGKGLYQEITGGIKILDNKLFRADIDLPASVPIGIYKTHIYEFSNGQIVASRTEDMKVAQVGLGARINAMARYQPLLYGLLSLFLSLGIGASSAYLFQRRA